MPRTAKVMGFAALYPSYNLLLKLPQRDRATASTLPVKVTRAPSEPFVKTSSAPIRAIAIRSSRTECRQMQNKDERPSRQRSP